MKYVDNIDWLQVTFHSKVEPYDTERLRFIPKTYGSSLFINGYSVILKDTQEEIFDLYTTPRVNESILKKDFKTIKFKNRFLYDGNILRYFQKIQEHFDFEDYNICRLDLCRDFEKFKNGLMPENFIDDCYNHKYILNAQGLKKTRYFDKKDIFEVPQETMRAIKREMKNLTPQERETVSKAMKILQEKVFNKIEKAKIYKYEYLLDIIKQSNIPQYMAILPSMQKTIKIGTGNSNIKKILYNKSVELAQAKDKPHIRAAHKPLNAAGDIWRLEFQIKGSRIEFACQDEPLHKFKIEDFADNNKLHAYLNYLVANEFKFKAKGKQINQRDWETLDLFTEEKQLKADMRIIALKSDSTRMNKIVALKLAQHYETARMNAIISEQDLRIEKKLLNRYLVENSLMEYYRKKIQPRMKNEYLKQTNK